MTKNKESIFFGLLVIGLFFVTTYPENTFAGGADRELMLQEISDSFWDMPYAFLYFIVILTVFGLGMYALSKSRFWINNSKGNKTT